MNLKPSPDYAWQKGTSFEATGLIDFGDQLARKITK